MSFRHKLYIYIYIYVIAHLCLFTSPGICTNGFLGHEVFIMKFNKEMEIVESLNSCHFCKSQKRRGRILVLALIIKISSPFIGDQRIQMSAPLGYCCRPWAVLQENSHSGTVGWRMWPRVTQVYRGISLNSSIKATLEFYTLYCVWLLSALKQP